MAFFFISFIAGVLTILAPCILPLLPIIIGSSEPGSRRSISPRAVRVILSLAVSVVVFTIVLRASTLLIAIPQSFWAYVSGSIIILVGVMMLFPGVWSRVPFVGALSRASNKAVGAGYQKKSAYGDFVVGAALGPVFTTCSPTYLFIIATILPATFAVGFVYLLGFTLGLVLALLAVAYFGQALISKVAARMGAAEMIKKVFGVLIILVGIAIFTGYDKKIEIAILDAGYGATIQFEEGLIERFNPFK